MKRKNIFRISILPLVVVLVLAVSNMQPQQQGKGKNNKEESQSGGKGKNEVNAGNDHSQGNNQGKGNAQDQGNNKGKAQDDRGQGNGNAQNKDNGNHNNGNNGVGNRQKGNPDQDYDNGHIVNGKMKHGMGNSAMMNGKRDVDLNWGFDDFSNRKRPGSQKKVTICHHPDGQNSAYPVTINISENAVQAHLNHGDQLGNCSVNYNDRWSSNYIHSREIIYNNYEQTWETMSYSEALLRFAADKLLGIRSDLNRTRVSLSPLEIQRREALISELQNNINSLENQLGITRQRLDSDVNIIIQL